MDELRERKGPFGGRQAALLAAYVGKWVALSGPLEVVAAADTPEEVLARLRRHGLTAEYGMFRVPTSEEEIAGDLIELDPRVQQMSTEELVEIVERQARALRKLESRNRMLDDELSRAPRREPD